MKEVLLVGFPNAGKTTLFNAWTHSREKTGNWHGVTVAPAEKRVGDLLFVDLPGLYSFRSLSLEEKVTKDYLLSHADALVVQVVSADRLLSSLSLTKELCSLGREPILVLTQSKRFLRGGGAVDTQVLSEELSLPVFQAEGFSFDSFFLERKNRGAKEFLPRLKGYRPARFPPSKGEKLLFSPFFSALAFLSFLLFTFFFCFSPVMPCALIKSVMEKGLAWLSGKVSNVITSPFARSFFCDCLLTGVGGVFCFLPQIAGLYFCTLLLEESGVLSFAAFALDDLLSPLGLSGRAVFSLCMGYGCTTTAVALTRGLPDRRMQKRAVFSMQFVPCSARLPVLLTLLSSLSASPFLFILLSYASCFCLSVAVAYFQREKRELVVWELPPLKAPSLRKAFKDLLFPVKQFIIKTAGVLSCFMIGTWLFSSLSPALLPCGVEDSLLAVVSKKLDFILRPIGIFDWKITLALLSGFAAKENMAGLLTLFYPTGLSLTQRQLLALVVCVMLCPPCLSCLAATVREIGKKAAFLFFIGQGILSLLCAYLAYAIGPFAPFLVALLIMAIAFFREKNYERISSKRKHNLKRLYG